MTGTKFWPGFAVPVTEYCTDVSSIGAWSATTVNVIRGALRDVDRPADDGDLRQVAYWIEHGARVGEPTGR